jgi:RNA polymerase sigma-70 factor (ECF subfamily)
MAWQKEKKTNFTDIELLEGCKAGKSKFQELLYKRFFSFAMGICIRYTPNTNDALEVVNDAFLKVFENIHSYDTTRPFNSWFSKVIVNSAIDSFRKTQKFHAEVTLNGAEAIEDHEPTMDEELSANEILMLFAQLPDTFRITFNLYEIEGYSHEEIGEMMGISTSTSRSNLTRAKKMLRKLYHMNHIKAANHYEQV